VRNLAVIATIAGATFREAVRDRVLYNVIFLSLGLIAFSIMLGDWSVFDRANVIRSFGISIAGISALLLSIFVGIQLLQREIQRRTVLAILSKPIYRGQFVLGKYLGLMAVVLLHLALMMGGVIVALALSNGKPGLNLLQPILMLTMEMSIVVAAAVLFSTFTTPTLASLFTLGTYIAGHLSGEVVKHIEFIQGMPSWGTLAPWSQKGILAVSWFVQRFFPDLDQFQTTAAILYGNAADQSHWLPLADVAWAGAHAAAWVGLLLSVSIFWFGKRDFQ